MTGKKVAVPLARSAVFEALGSINGFSDASVSFRLFVRCRNTKYCYKDEAQNIYRIRPLLLLERVFPSLLVASKNLPQKKLYFTVLD